MSLPNWAVTLIAIVAIIIVAGIILYLYIKRKKNEKISNSENHFLSNYFKKEVKLPTGKKFWNLFSTFNNNEKNDESEVDNLYFVIPKIAPCRLCRKWEGRVLSLVKSKNFETMEKAIEEGYHHLGCTCIDLPLKKMTYDFDRPFPIQKQSRAFQDKITQYNFEKAFRDLNKKIKENNENKELKEIYLKLEQDYLIFLQGKIHLSRDEKYENPDLDFLETLH
ncbi:hypothetical protein [[Mycoplasma] testudinis]|uniref:hypothetical protein n=1 Tax=[Mycoplasma] testudinis TaxID=33924 RepID=UPI000483A38D|nr:hypothetical protein [[Mycoplasma] testudinis]